MLLNQESTDNAVLDAVGASRTTVGALDGLLGAGDGSVLAGTEGGDTGKLETAVAALGSSSLLLNVQVSELSTRGLDHADIVAGGVVGSPSAVGKTSGRHF